MSNITDNNPLTLSHAHLYEALTELRAALHATKDWQKKNVQRDFSLMVAEAQATKALRYADELLNR